MLERPRCRNNAAGALLRCDSSSPARETDPQHADQDRRSPYSGRREIPRPCLKRCSKMS
jgi:hypothetical protein